MLSLFTLKMWRLGLALRRPEGPRISTGGLAKDFVQLESFHKLPRKLRTIRWSGNINTSHSTEHGGTSDCHAMNAPVGCFPEIN